MTVNVASVASLSADDLAMQVPVAIVGAGAAGLIAALSAADQGCDVIVFERDSAPTGSTALSAGLIPAPATRWQQQMDIDDTVDGFVRDILNKSGCTADEDQAHLVAGRVTDTLHWLADTHNVEFSLVDGFTYPGHSVKRMHGTPRRTGQELIDALLDAVGRQPRIDLVCDARVDTLFTSDTKTGQPVRIAAIGVRRPDGTREIVGVDALILACNGYGGNPDLVATHMPVMRDALYFGHAGNTGDAVLWGQSIGAATDHLGAFQGHGSVAHPHGILITWAVMMQGGVQLNRSGCRFSNEHAGYSEQAAIVASQPDGIGFNVYDSRIHNIALQFEDYRNAVDSGAIKEIATDEALAAMIGADVQSVVQTMANTRSLCDTRGTDDFGRRFGPDHRLERPYYVVCVEGALFHTQGGLVINDRSQVLDTKYQAFPNLFAAGGAAKGISGSDDSGYLSGNGLLTAVALGAIAGETAAQLSVDAGAG